MGLSLASNSTSIVQKPSSMELHSARYFSSVSPTASGNASTLADDFIEYIWQKTLHLVGQVSRIAKCRLLQRVRSEKPLIRRSAKGHLSGFEAFRAGD